MALPEPYDEEESASQDEAPADPGSAGKPDWLVAAEEALESEFGRSGTDPEQVQPELRSATPAPSSRPQGPRPPNPYEGFAQSAAGQASGDRWLDAGPPVPAASQSQTARVSDGERDPDDPFGHGRAREEAAAQDQDLAGPETPDAAAERSFAPLQMAAPKPWLEVLLGQIFSPLGLLVMAAAAIAVILGMLHARPKDNSVPLSKIRHDSARYDGQQVRVHGKVGEVYPFGGGYSFYLLQGRDTIVVFTRTRTPVSGEHVSLLGSVSTGVLNGEVRQALLESSP